MSKNISRLLVLTAAFGLLTSTALFNSAGVQFASPAAAGNIQPRRARGRDCCCYIRRMEETSKIRELPILRPVKSGRSRALRSKICS